MNLRIIIFSEDLHVAVVETFKMLILRSDVNYDTVSFRAISISNVANSSSVLNPKSERNY